MSTLVPSRRSHLVAVVVTVAGLVAASVLGLGSGWTGGHAPDLSAPANAAPVVTVTSPALRRTSLDRVVVAGLGDSVTAGSNCDCRDYVLKYGDLVRRRTGRATTVANMGKGGLRSDQLLSALRRPGPMAAQVAGSRVVLLTIGANDFYPELSRWRSSGCDRSCWGPRAEQLRRNIAAIVRQIHRLRGPRWTVVMVTDYWNVFEDGQVADQDYSPALVRWSDHLTRVADRFICTGARASGARCTDLYRPFKDVDGSKDPTPLLAGDGDHPNAAGHRVIARALAATFLPRVG